MKKKILIFAGIIGNLLWLALYTKELHFCNVVRFWSAYGVKIHMLKYIYTSESSYITKMKFSCIQSQPKKDFQ